MNIKRDIMASSRNYTKCSSRTIKYIVIHGTGYVAPCKNYCLNLKNNKCSGSAHYFVGDGEIRQAIDDNNIAWHVGNPNNCYKVKNSDCKNKNSLGIEMCELNKNTGEVAESTKKLTGELVRYLMKKYNVPSSRVIRHNDVLSKPCPTGFLTDSKWKVLKEILVNGSDVSHGTFKPYLVRVKSSDGYLNARKGAGTNYQIETVLKNGTVVTVIEKSGNWGKCKSGYWINLNYTEYIRLV